MESRDWSIEVEIVNQQQVRDKLIAEYCYKRCKDYIECSLNGFKRIWLSDYLRHATDKYKGETRSFSKGGSYDGVNGTNCTFTCINDPEWQRKQKKK